MLKNYFKTAWRNMANTMGYSAINILGLSIGMSVALLIWLWVFNEYSYDRFLPGYEQAYQVRVNLSSNGEIINHNAVALPLADVLKKDIPEIKYVAESDWMGEHSLKAGETKLYIAGAQAGSDFLKIFQFPFLQGDPNTSLADPYSIVLTRSTAISLFGNENPINKFVRFDNAHDLKVTGILKDLPRNSSFHFNYIVPFTYYESTAGWVNQARISWMYSSFQEFVALQPGVTYSQIEPKLKNLFKKYAPDQYNAVRSEAVLQPLKDWHLYTDFKNGKAIGGFVEYVRLFSIIGALVLFIACINFINISTARSEKRAKEVGIRKTMGSSHRNLIFQFLTESIVVTFAAFLISILLIQLALPFFNILTKSAISIPWSNPGFWGMMIGYLLITGLLAGIWPAFYLSSFSPVKVLKGNLKMGGNATLPRKILVIIQFSCSVALIISTVIVYKQIQYVRNRPVGYDINRLIMTDLSSDLMNNYAALKNDLLKSGVVTDVTSASSPVTGINAWIGVDDWKGKYPNEILRMATIAVSGDYFNTLGMKMRSGRFFTDNLGADTLNVILNEAAVKRMRLKDPLNQTITYFNKQKQLRIIGIVKDALMLSPFNPVEPTFFIYQPGWASNILYRLSPAVNTEYAITKLSPIFDKYNPAYPLVYHFADESYAGKFNLEVLIGKLTAIFSGLAIFISCLGLFGLSAYVAEQRTKEISIRKILGASVWQLWRLLSMEFLLLVLISCFIASPLAWYFLQEWLQKYSYRINISPGVFLISAIMAIVITIITISSQAIKAAIANPAKSLRTE